MRPPIIYEKTKDGEIVYDIFSRLSKDRIIFLYGAIDEEIGATIASTLLYMNRQSDSKPISLYIESVGGLVHGGLFPIFDMMNYIKAPIKTVCMGEACSAATTILANGKKGMRYALPNSCIMIHELQSGVRGPVSDVVKHAKLVDFWNNRHISILSKLTGKTEEVVKTAVKEETFFTAEEAKEFGLIDKIVKSLADTEE